MYVLVKLCCLNYGRFHNGRKDYFLFFIQVVYLSLNRQISEEAPSRLAGRTRIELICYKPNKHLITQLTFSLCVRVIRGHGAYTILQILAERLNKRAYSRLS